MNTQINKTEKKKKDNFHKSGKQRARKVQRWQEAIARQQVNVEAAVKSGDKEKIAKVQKTLKEVTGNPGKYLRNNK